MAKQTTSTPRDKTTRTEGRGAGRFALGGRGGGRTGAEPASRTRGPSLAAFFQESRAELNKVTWPTRQEAMNLTAAVIAMTVALALFLGLIDTILDFLVKPLLGS